MEIIIEGTLLELSFCADTLYDIHTTLAVENEGRVKPLSMLIMSEFEKLSLDERIVYFKKSCGNTTVKVKCGEEETIVSMPSYFQFRLSGWESNDDYESSNGVTIYDTFIKPEDKKSKQKENFYDKISAFVGKKVKITVG